MPFCLIVMSRSFPYIVTAVPLLCHNCDIVLSQACHYVVTRGW